MLLRAQFRGFVAEQLRRANTAAGQAVFENRALPTKPADMPVICLYTPHEAKESTGRGAPKFTTTVHLVIQGRVSAADDATTAAALEALTEQIEMATLANAAVVRKCQQFRGIETTSSVTVEGTRPVGEVTMVLMVELYQVYDPAMPDRLAEIDVTRNPDPAATPNLLRIALPT